MKEHTKNKVSRITCGFLFQPGGVWLGVHYSRHNHRFCVNVIPCFTFWIALPNGFTP